MNNDEYIDIVHETSSTVDNWLVAASQVRNGGPFFSFALLEAFISDLHVVQNEKRANTSFFRGGQMNPSGTGFRNGQMRY